jgi:hypothetical protein
MTTVAREKWAHEIAIVEEEDGFHQHIKNLTGILPSISG